MVDRSVCADLVIDEDKDDVWLLLLRSRLLVGNVSPVGLGLLSRQQVQAEEKAPQHRGGGGRRRLHVGPRNPAENNNPRQQCREVGHQRRAGKNVPSQHKFPQAYHEQGTTIDHKTTLEMASPAWLHVRAEARPSGGETLKVLLFFNLLQPPELRNASGRRTISSAWTGDIPKYAAVGAKFSGNQIMNYSCLLL